MRVRLHEACQQVCRQGFREGSGCVRVSVLCCLCANSCLMRLLNKQAMPDHKSCCEIAANTKKPGVTSVLFGLKWDTHMSDKAIDCVDTTSWVVPTH